MKSSPINLTDANYMDKYIIWSYHLISTVTFQWSTCGREQMVCSMTSVIPERAEFPQVRESGTHTVRLSAGNAHIRYLAGVHLSSLFLSFLCHRDTPQSGVILHVSLHLNWVRSTLTSV